MGYDKPYTPFPISYVTWTLVCPGPQSTFRILPLLRRGPVAIHAQRRIPRLARSWRTINGKFGTTTVTDFGWICQEER